MHRKSDYWRRAGVLFTAMAGLALSAVNAAEPLWQGQGQGKPGVAPDAHHYVFTVYALDTELKVSTLPNFPANAETIYHALIHAARGGHILASGSLGTYYSDTPPTN